MRRTCLALDLGGSRVRVALVRMQAKARHDWCSTVVWLRSEATVNKGQPSQVVDQIVRIIGSDMPDDLCGIAVAAPGPLDTNDGVIRRIPTLAGWNNVPFKSLLAQRFGLPVWLENDAIAAAVGQWRFGAAKGFDSVLYLTISTGIGGGIIDNGHIVRGAHGFAGHIGHMLLHPESRQPCVCGRFGCFEAYASGTALDQHARQMQSQGSDECRTLWRSITAAQIPSAIHLAQAAAAGHTPSIDVLRKQGEYLAQGICSLVHTLNPQVVVLGGGVSNSYEWFAAAMLEKLDDILMPEFIDVQIRQAEMPDASGILGSASMLVDSLQIR